MERPHEKLDFADGYRVSTVFLGLNHAPEGLKPLIWETMVFWEGPSDWVNADPAQMDHYQVRTSTRDEAISVHNDIIKNIRNEQSWR